MGDTDIKIIIYDFENALLTNYICNDNHVLDTNININDLFGGNERIEMLKQHFDFVSNEMNCLLFLLCRDQQLKFDKIHSILNKLELSKYFVSSVKSTKMNSKSREFVIVSIMKHLNLTYNQILYVDSDATNINNLRKYRLCYYYFISNWNQNENQDGRSSSGLQLIDVKLIQQKLRPKTNTNTNTNTNENHLQLSLCILDQ